MNQEKQKALEDSGFVFGDAEDFLELTEEERIQVEHKLRVRELANKAAITHREPLKKLSE